MTRFWSIALAISLGLAAGCEEKKEAAAPSTRAEAAAENAPENTPEPGEGGAEAAPEGEAEAGGGAEAGGEAEAGGDRFLSAKETMAIEIKPGETQHFGAKFTLSDEPMEVSAALEQLDALGDKKIRLKGTVLSSCAKKGCWMMLATPEGVDPIRVSFVDYGFFVPPSSKGATAILEGTLEAKTETESARKHYAEDGNKSPEEIATIKGDKLRLRFLATGVEITRPSI